MACTRRSRRRHPTASSSEHRPIARRRTGEASDNSYDHDYRASANDSTSYDSTSYDSTPNYAASNYATSDDSTASATRLP